jgi:hypothetical protein
MPWNRGARVSKEDHRAAPEHVLRPGEAQCARVGAGDAGGTRGGLGGGGATWRGPARVGEAAARMQGRHVPRGKAGARHMAGGAARSGANKNRGAEGWR